MNNVKPALAVIGLLGAAAAMTFSTVPAFAQQSASDLQRVEISGHKLPEAPRHDVSRVCPSAAQSLQDALAMTAYREGTAATVRMQFRLTGSRIDEVSAATGPSEYRKAARRAVRRLDCIDTASTGGQPQQFSFLISFNAPEDEAREGPGSRVALLEH